MERVSGFYIVSPGNIYRRTTHHGSMVMTRLDTYVPVKHVHDGTALTERNTEYLRGYLPYVIGKDYQRLVRLTRKWIYMECRHMHGPSLAMLSGQCEDLYYKIYRSICCYGTPFPGMPESYERREG